MIQIHARETAAARIKRIREALRSAADSFINAGADLRAAKEAQEWLALGLANFGEYCAKLDVQESWASDLIHIAQYAEQFPPYRARMLDVGVSKMRLLVPHMRDEGDANRMDTLLDMASEKSYRELAQELRASDADHPLPPAVNYCPACGVKLHLSRAAHLEVAE